MLELTINIGGGRSAHEGSSGPRCGFRGGSETTTTSSAKSKVTRFTSKGDVSSRQPILKISSPSLLSLWARMAEFASNFSIPLEFLQPLNIATNQSRLVLIITRHLLINSECSGVIPAVAGEYRGG